MSVDAQQKLKMLIVDDESDNLDLLYRTFRLDYQVYRAQSAPAALELLEQQGEMAIIISDQRMPEMLGTEFLSRTAEKYPDTIRIVLTAYTDVKDLVDAINSGKVFKYITKPWQQDQLQAVVHQSTDTYRLVKQRTASLQRSLRRESIFNTVTTAIRESLDYSSMLQTIVQTIAQSFNATYGVLHPVEAERRSHKFVHYIQGDVTLTAAEMVQPVDGILNQVLTSRQTQVSSVPHGEQTLQHLILPFRYQDDVLAVLDLVRSADVPTWSPSEIDLLEGVAEQAALAVSQAMLYRRSQQQAEQMRAELSVARQVQNNLLRQTMPELSNLKVQACCHPAREVGGDFFEVYEHSNGDVWLAVGDVSGKGVPAALFMASAISVLRREMSQDPPPHPKEVMANLNRALMDDLVSTNCFITMVLARFTPSTGELQYANAGHIYPMVWSTATPQQAPDYLTDRGIPIGILPIWKGQAGSRPLQSGEIFLLTSDGVTEASVLGSEALGQPSMSPVQLQQSGLWQLLTEQQSAFDLKHLLENIRQHTVAQEDDQTMLSLEVL
jgi:serine phosphatase RsbU (regulator of sigma subunit)/FixJ family two-component response regulator